MSRALPQSIVVVVGASPNPERYSYMAVRLLTEYGFRAVPVHPAARIVVGVQSRKSLSEIDGIVDTITMYVNKAVSEELYDDIARLRPRRVIFNPGAENEELAQRLSGAGIEVIEACTLVMLRTNQF